MKKFGHIISLLFEPMGVLTILAILGGFHAGLTGATLQYYLSFIVVGMIGPVVAYRIWLLRTHQADWDLTDRKKRIKPLFMQVGIFFLDLLVIVLFGSRQLDMLFLTVFVWLVGFAGITTQWKMSGHTATLALATGFLIIWYGWAWWPTLLLVALLGWARVVHRDHTVTQVIIGAGYAWLLIFAISQLGSHVL